MITKLSRYLLCQKRSKMQYTPLCNVYLPKKPLWKKKVTKTPHVITSQRQKPLWQTFVSFTRVLWVWLCNFGLIWVWEDKITPWYLLLCKGLENWPTSSFMCRPNPSIRGSPLLDGGHHHLRNAGQGTPLRRHHNIHSRPDEEKEAGDQHKDGRKP